MNKKENSEWTSQIKHMKKNPVAIREVKNVFFIFLFHMSGQAALLSVELVSHCSRI